VFLVNNVNVGPVPVIIVYVEFAKKTIAYVSLCQNVNESICFASYCLREHGTQNTFICCIIGKVKHVQLGASIELTCRSVFYHSVLWYYSELDSEKSHILYWDDIFTKDKLRFEVLRPNSSRGVFDLSIRNAQLSDSGMYRCTEHSGQHPGEVRYILNVTGQWILLDI